MKKITRVMLASAATLPIVGFASLGFANAALDTNSDTFAQKFATKFNLKTEDVKSFMTEQRSAREAEMKTIAADALKTAGLSDSQISALQTKRGEQRSAHEAWRTANPNATQAERQAHRDASKTDLETWAAEQGIDLAKVKDALKAADIGPFGSNRGHRAHGTGMMNGDTPGADTSN